MKLILLLQVILFFSNQVFSDQKDNDIEWSAYQGQMKWDAGVARCTGLGMKLPNRTELKIAFKNGTSKGWEKDGLWYWSSEEFSKANAYYLSVQNGDIFHAFKFNNGHVRCIRSFRSVIENSVKVPEKKRYR